MKTKLTFALALTAALAGMAQATPMTLGAATGYNVFTFGNFSEYGTNAEGKMAVGGDFAPANGGSFTIAATRQADGAGVYDLVVGGNFLQTGNTMNGGDVYVGGNMTWNNPTLPHNAYVKGNFTNNSYGSTSGTIYYAGTYSSVGTLAHTQVSAASLTIPIDFVSAATSLASVSAALASTTANEGNHTRGAPPARQWPGPLAGYAAIAGNCRAARYPQCEQPHRRRPRAWPRHRHRSTRPRYGCPYGARWRPPGRRFLHGWQ